MHRIGSMTKDLTDRESHIEQLKAQIGSGYAQEHSWTQELATAKQEQASKLQALNTQLQNALHQANTKAKEAEAATGKTRECEASNSELRAKISELESRSSAPGPSTVRPNDSELNELTLKLGIAETRLTDKDELLATVKHMGAEHLQA